jgi:exopolyphosphatase/guanosine-5'-triphosphate,3'-diphosphate pyrophosphatase
MRFAAIDVGSNTLRLLICDVRGNVLSRVHAERAVTRLAEGIRATGLIRRENMKESISVLKDFAASLPGYGAAMVRAVGTSALREAGNGAEFVEMAFRETGVRIEVISGAREAELTAKGILQGIAENEDSLIIDIGGGSTEWIIHLGKGALRTPVRGSILLGVVTLFEGFIRTDPPSPQEIEALNREIDSGLVTLAGKVSGEPAGEGDLPHLRNLIGTGGSITTLAALDLGLKEYDYEKVHMHRISLNRLYALRDMLLSLPLNERKDIDGLEWERADLIIPGILLTIKFMEFFGFGVITVSDHGLLEGLIKEMSDEQGF